MGNTRGVALGIVVVIALVCAVAAYVVLMAATSEARRAKFFRERTEARHLAEAGLVVAMQKLWNESVTPYPPGCPAGGTATATEAVDTNGNGVDASDPTVAVTVVNCGVGNQHTLQATVSY